MPGHAPIIPGIRRPPRDCSQRARPAVVRIAPRSRPMQPARMPLIHPSFPHILRIAHDRPVAHRNGHSGTEVPHDPASALRQRLYKGSATCCGARYFACFHWSSVSSSHDHRPRSHRACTISMRRRVASPAPSHQGSHHARRARRRRHAVSMFLCAPVASRSFPCILSNRPVYHQGVLQTIALHYQHPKRKEKPAGQGVLRVAFLYLSTPTMLSVGVCKRDDVARFSIVV